MSALGGEVHPVKLGLDFPWKFRRLLSEHRFGAVHSHVHYSSGFILRLAAQAGIPVRIAHFRSTHDDHGDTLRRRLQRRGPQSLDRPLCNAYPGRERGGNGIFLGPGLGE